MEIESGAGKLSLAYENRETCARAPSETPLRGGRVRKRPPGLLPPSLALPAMRAFSPRCAACQQETTQECSACRAIHFCSRRCQSLVSDPLSLPLSGRTLSFRGEADAPHRQLWPTHKVLCGRDPDVFVPPFGSSSGEGSQRRPDQRTAQEVRLGMVPVRRRARRAEDGQHTSGRQAAGRQQR